MELLKNSPYKDKLASAGLFLKQLDADSKTLPVLINPHLGNRIYLADQLVSSAPNLQPAKLDQIAALAHRCAVEAGPMERSRLLVEGQTVAAAFCAREDAI